MKWIGAAICFCISVAIGCTAGKNEKVRTEQCEAFLEFFVYNRVKKMSKRTPDCARCTKKK